jgi:hypothetical protein
MRITVAIIYASAASPPTVASASVATLVMNACSRVFCRKAFGTARRALGRL